MQLYSLRKEEAYEKYMVYYSCLPDDIAVRLWKQGARNNEKSKNGVYPGRGLRKTGICDSVQLPLIKNGIYAVLNENGSIEGYMKLVKDGEEYVWIESSFNEAYQ